MVDRVLHTVEHMEEVIQVAKRLARKDGAMDEVVHYFNKLVGEQSGYQIDLQQLHTKITNTIKNCASIKARAEKIQKGWAERYPRPRSCGQVKYGDPIIHVIQPNENITVICRRYGVTEAEVRAINHIPFSDRNLIPAGGTLKIPRFGSPEPR